jgi:hypothetical protein
MSLVFLFTGCASFKTINIKEKELPAKNSISAVLYSKSFFQERFMGKEIGYQFLPIGNILQYKIEDYDKRKGARLESSDFEKLLDDFDVSIYFDSQLRKDIGKAKLVKIVFEKDAEKTKQIVQFIAADKKDDKSAGNNLKPNTPVAAFKISYGLAVRGGTENIGLRKYYRPFIRLIGRIKIAGSDEVIWQDAMIAFGENRYLGNDADASKIKKEELVQSYQQLTTEVIEMLVRSLNGEKLGEMPLLTGHNKADNTF